MGSDSEKYFLKLGKVVLERLYIRETKRSYAHGTGNGENCL